MTNQALCPTCWHVILGPLTAAFTNFIFYRFWRFKSGSICTSDDLDLYYAHKAQEMMLLNVRDTIHADSLALFELNIESLLADASATSRCHQARKVEHFDFDLTCDVTGDPEVIKICFPSTVFPELLNAAWLFRVGPVVSEILGGSK